MNSAQIGRMIAEVVEGLRKNGEEGDAQIEARIKGASRRALLRTLPDLSGLSYIHPLKL